MRKKGKILFFVFFIILVNVLIFGYVYFKNYISVSLFLNGNKLTSNDEIFEKFEKKTDVFYWYIKKKEIEENIRLLPYVKDVKIYPKSVKNFDKINIDIVEEEPYFLSKLKDNNFELISNDGKILSILSKVDILKNNRDFFNILPTITGLDVNLDSAQTMASRLLHITKFIKQLRKSFKYTVYSINYLPSGDVELSFAELKPKIIMDISKSEKFLETQIRRLKAIEIKLGSNINTLSQIDLGFGKVGVLTK